LHSLTRHDVSTKLCEEMARPIVKVLTGFALLAALVVVGAIFFTLRQPAPAPPPLPDPNGYEDLVKAGGMIEGDVSDYGMMGQEELRTALVKNAEALRLAKKGLDRESRVPPDYSPTNSAHLNQLAAIKRLGQTFVAEGRLAEMEHHPQEAAQYYLDTFRLGIAVARGGVIIDSLVGLAIETPGLAALEKLRADLDAKQCREITSALEAAERGREPTEAILGQERTWARRTFGFKGQLARLVTFKQLKQGEQRWTGKMKAHETRTRQLLIQLATRAYELERGAPPKNVSDLVPEYLQAVPLGTSSQQRSEKR
jgi:hypothetical protein